MTFGLLYLHDISATYLKDHYERKAIVEGKIKKEMLTNFVPLSLKVEIIRDARLIQKRMKVLSPYWKKRNNIQTILDYCPWGGVVALFLFFDAEFRQFIIFGSGMFSFFVLCIWKDFLQLKLALLEDEIGTKVLFIYKSGDSELMLRSDSLMPINYNGDGGVHIVTDMRNVCVGDPNLGDPFDDLTYY